MFKEADALQMYFGEPLVISNGKIKVTQATLGDVITQGESSYYGMVHTLTAWPCDYISFLHDRGLNYMDVPDLEFFHYLSKVIPVEQTKVLFGDLDFSKFELAKRNSDDAVVLYNEEQDILIDEIVYAEMHKYLCDTHLIKKKRRKAGNKSTYLLQVDVDRQDKELAKIKKSESSLQSMISAMVNHPGFKYSIDEVRKLTIYQFMDSVSRISTMVASERFAHGYFSGNIDPKKIDITKRLDWMRNLQE